MSDNLEQDLKQLIISTLDLEDIHSDDIDSEAPLFGDGLGLDSIDALELGLAVSKQYDIKIDADDEATRRHFASVRALADLIREHG
ncbi:MAG: phosphopantetheine-binding protein [Alcanivorax sp.]|jgi:acyl carrier protein|nr:acyl carrier protein [Dinoroseobacter sp.]MBL4714026.1 acyl carrier protein [Alcanivorax sp.]MEA3258573.1 phosphopantetheine-binding protein [Pseudomonadota bacterium]HAM77353.1 acyl carrier protein [Alcanivorax sp.]|tara:strand:- start:222 stop:479 length:258 start_codon:yes stop_codon:yes gene_type:complete